MQPIAISLNGLRRLPSREVPAARSGQLLLVVSKAVTWDDVCDDAHLLAAGGS
jgi:hypothetical protein